MALSLAACGSLPVINVQSDPPGATVIASGRDLGTTPLKISPDDVFPPRFVGSGYRATGLLEIKRSGCKPFQQDVNDAVLSKDISVRLECDPAAVRAAEPSPVSRASADRAGATELSASIRQRLNALEGLRRDKLVSETEYHSIRKRILDGL